MRDTSHDNGKDKDDVPEAPSLPPHPPLQIWLHPLCSPMRVCGAWCRVEAMGRFGLGLARGLPMGERKSPLALVEGVATCLSLPLPRPPSAALPAAAGGTVAVANVLERRCRALLKNAPPMPKHLSHPRSLGRTPGRGMAS